MHRQRGQILIIIILLSTVLITVALSISQITTQETQVAKLEEESKKAFAAAEAGIDAALKTGDVTIGEEAGQLNVGEGITGQATVETTKKPTFVTPLLKKDEQYTLYLADYNTTNNSFSGYFSGSLTFYLDNNGGSDCPAIELTLISSSDTITRRLIDPCTQAGPIDIPTTNSGAPFKLKGIDFYYKTSSSLSVNNTKLIIARVLFEETRIGIDAEGVNLPLQGKTVTSQAKTSTGVAKKIQLFQSYPQIPAEFFVTSF